jgi:hypothetical protein
MERDYLKKKKEKRKKDMLVYVGNQNGGVLEYIMYTAYKSNPSL